ncbi:methylaspartate mutase sigma subunit [Kitasatospora sp. MAA4]|uniref:cobalamin-dependent protein n=1 Tax=Kitasatospora sp. MAA4 TaxID=3035093 RepID=UPI002474A2C4|nr:cobalamin-dependent protein [Kitasatospora sp. MAA4]MDH6135445.1 methylaspartate mutase sigma subunit [Kitasatospora sp. MAA4]
MTSKTPLQSETSLPSAVFGPADRTGRTVILGVAASDSHAVANHLIAHALRAQGLTVVNLGTCTPVSEFADACERHPDAEAVIVGSLNGHIHEDLHDLAEAKQEGRIPCPVIVGGNLSVGSTKDESAITRLFELGVDHVLRRPADLAPLLDSLLPARSVRPLATSVAR